MTPDVNVLVAAATPDHSHHREAHAWLAGALSACATGGSVEILPMVAAGFLRLVTNARIFPRPLSARDGVAFLKAILGVPGATMPALGAEWARVERLCVDLGLAANDIPDAWIAAAVSVNGLHLVTFDAGFAQLLRPSEFTLLRKGVEVRERGARYAVRRVRRRASGR